MLNFPLYWRTFYCLQSQGIVKYQALLVSPKFSYLVALLWKIRTLLCPVTRFFLKSTTVEGVEFPLYWRTFYCLQSQGIVKYQALLVSPKFSFLVALLKNKNPIMPSYPIFSKKHNGGGCWIFHIEGLSTVYTGYSEVPSPAGFSKI